jgi:hypothetical protein
VKALPLPGWGVDWIDHDVPFQISAEDPPTASQKAVDVHETLASSGPEAVDWIDHFVPPQPSASANVSELFA